jgi:hypothetical protein
MLKTSSFITFCHKLIINKMSTSDVSECLLTTVCESTLFCCYTGKYRANITVYVHNKRYHGKVLLKNRTFKCKVMKDLFLLLGTCFCYLKCVFVTWNVFLLLGTCFVTWNVFLLLGTWFCYLERGFVTWNVFLSLGTCFCHLKRVFVTWNVFLSLGTCFCYLERVFVTLNVFLLL